ncbi:MAG: mechanosensitive ion channel family protein [Candidatus Verstraetearchaeota archaeon]|nr:mechanosensitive ion channel family protein [Candidatus Verstraetearchaeota archaeon]
MEILQWFQLNWYKLLYFAIIVIIALFISTIIERTVKRALIRRFSKNVIDNVVKIIRYGILIIAIIIALTSIGIDVTGALIAGGFLGIVIGFAAQASISNFISGLLLLLERPFKIGDFIHVGNIVGMVSEVGILSTTIVTWDGIKVRIPSSQLFNSDFRNYTASKVRLVSIEVQIPYSANMEKAIESIKSKLEKQWYILEEPKPIVFAKTFANDGIVLEIRAWTAGSTWFTLFSNLPRLVKDALDEVGIQIPYPQRVVWFASSLKTE